ncbi:MAG: hypothetical protein GF334_02880 [Candidatus Altiarchaeales archaeon]|nr:hypothetical protein [Candidatus Altiarchaeales archaeon]
MPKQDFTQECLADCRKSKTPLVNQVKEVPHLRERYCKQCRNKFCAWASLSEDLFEKRVKTQEDRFLNNPNFADEDHPRYFEVRAIDFPDLMREAIILETSDRRQDWEIPTIEESVSTILQSAPEAVRTKQVDEAVKALAEARGKEPPEVPEPRKDNEREIGKMEDSGAFLVSVPSRTKEDKSYRVFLDESGKALRCDCKAGQFEKRCSHLRDAERMFRSGVVNPPPPSPPPESPSFKPPAPEMEGQTEGKRTTLFPTSDKINTPVSQQGIYVGGGQGNALPVPSQAPEVDPWEPTGDDFVEVGSTITIETKK